MNNGTKFYEGNFASATQLEQIAQEVEKTIYSTVLESTANGFIITVDSNGNPINLKKFNIVNIRMLLFQYFQFFFFFGMLKYFFSEGLQKDDGEESSEGKWDLSKMLEERRAARMPFIEEEVRRIIANLFIIMTHVRQEGC
jgi:hypothetical protein